MVNYRQEAVQFFTLLKVTAILALGLIMSFAAPIWAKPKGPYGATTLVVERESRKRPIVQRWDFIGDPYEETIHMHIARKKRRSPESMEDLERNRGNDQGLSPKEQDRLKRKRMEWEALPPEKQKVMRQRMKRLKEFSPEDRELFRQRFNQWKRLSPEERRRIRQDLDKWDSLPLQEREQIRRRFLTQ
ncbi:MAG: DUF3106 domain-containing protein [Desulfobacteraceae bacterium]|nr:MAG: DUF3106 domain-containing protein [Desulfobacteraceae bacterium]